MNLNIQKITLPSGPGVRRLKGNWSVELAEDLSMFHGTGSARDRILAALTHNDMFRVEPCETRLSRRLKPGATMWIGPAKLVSWNDDFDFHFMEVEEPAPVIYIDTVRVKVYGQKNAVQPDLVAVLYRCLFKGRLVAIPDRLRFLC